jgi:hypothetical protein
MQSLRLPSSLRSSSISFLDVVGKGFAYTVLYLAEVRMKPIRRQGKILLSFAPYSGKSICMKLKNKVHLCRGCLPDFVVPCKQNVAEIIWRTITCPCLHFLSSKKRGTKPLCGRGEGSDPRLRRGERISLFGEGERVTVLGPEE